MSSRPWYKRYGADFVHGALGLTLEEKGAYSLCLDLIYDRGGAIPDDPRWLAGVCGVSVKKWKILRQALIEAGKIRETDGGLTNDRAEKELENAAKMARKHAENGAKGGQKRAENEAEAKENNDIDEARLKHRARDQKPEARDQKKQVANATLSQGDDFPLDELWELWPPVGRKRSSKLKVERALRRVPKRDWPDLLVGARAYVRSEDCARSGGQGLHTWITDERWREWAKANAPPARMSDEDRDAGRLKRFLDSGGRFWPESYGVRPDDPGSPLHGRWRQAVDEGAQGLAAQ